MPKPKIYPVIHLKNWDILHAEAHIILNTPGVVGVFLISHHNDPETDWLLMHHASAIKRDFPNHQIGVNLLSIYDDVGVIASAGTVRLDMVWFDHMDSLDVPNPKNLQIFAGVAFKGQHQEADPLAAAEAIRAAGFIPTTSGEKTGIPPSVEKIRYLSNDGAKPLANASGMGPENISTYAPYLSHVLVSTNISRNFHEVDESKLQAFIAAAS